MFKGLKKAGDDFVSGNTAVFPSGITESIVYKTKMTFRDKEFSSLTYLNAINDSVFKIVLLTSFGNTLLEAQISKDKFIVNNVISYLNRKIILKLIEKDWRLVLASNLSREAPFMYPSADNGFRVFDYQSGRKNNLYYYNISQKYVSKIEAYKGKSPKTNIAITSIENTIPGSINIDHPSLRLKMEMTLLKKVDNDSAE